ncbi:MAG: hypothetical protein IH624_03245 [Phycisphaerae bacterium]|nr:hypothetical protein [Phycisphaerae bacterium]
MNLPTGACIVIAGTLLFLCSLLIRRILGPAAENRYPAQVLASSIMAR